VGSKLRAGFPRRVARHVARTHVAQRLTYEWQAKGAIVTSVVASAGHVSVLVDGAAADVALKEDNLQREPPDELSARIISAGMKLGETVPPPTATDNDIAAFSMPSSSMLQA
jgi:hypothetical protein